MIHSILIKNFRSIETLSINCSDITTFVGQNDAGKSNLLRALNLFFNGDTDHAIQYDFKRDFNAFAVEKKNKAKEIVIELRIRLPDSYQRDGYPELVLWRKAWRYNGLHEPGCYWSYVDGTQFPSRSRVPSLLERIAYNYVPAIKDKSFFADLQGQVYDVLAAVAETALHKSASSFENEIQDHLKELLSSVSDAFQADSIMRLPQNLREIFENLEFNANGIPLSRRGDGIKIRHIPMILRFISEKRNSIHKQGISPHIWGFEEPENNVEMAACFHMAHQFLNATDDGYQIFLTTHSPVFYGMGEDAASNSRVMVYRVAKGDTHSEVAPLVRQAVDDEMGLMPLVTPYIIKERKAWESRLEEARRDTEQVRELLEVARADAAVIPQIFVEGESDKKIVEKAIKTFFPSLFEQVGVVCGGETGYGSARAAANRAVAWQLTQETERSPLRAAVLLDKDLAGSEAKKVFEEATQGKPRKIVRAFQWRSPANLVPLLKAGFGIPLELEALYLDDIWEMAEEKRWLVHLEAPHKRLSSAKQEEIIMSALSGSTLNPFHGLDAGTRRRLTMEFSDNGKQKAAQYIANLSKPNAEVALGNLEVVLGEVLSHLLSEAVGN